MTMPRMDLIHMIAEDAGVPVYESEMVPEGYGYPWPRTDGLAHCIACKHPFGSFYHQNGTVEHFDPPRQHEVFNYS